MLSSMNRSLRPMVARSTTMTPRVMRMSTTATFDLEGSYEVRRSVTNRLLPRFRRHSFLRKDTTESHVTYMAPDELAIIMMLGSLSDERIASTTFTFLALFAEDIHMLPCVLVLLNTDVEKPMEYQYRSLFVSYFKKTFHFHSQFNSIHSSVQLRSFQRLTNILPLVSPICIRTLHYNLALI